MTYQSKDIDIEKSLKQSPPSYPTGVIFIKRIRVKRGLCTWLETQEFRVQGKNKDNVSSLKDSYIVNGLLYDEPVQVVEKDRDNKDRFKGIAGYHRDSAQEQLGWDYAIYDVVEFKTPRIRLSFGYTSNHHRPAQTTTRHDIFKGISKAIDTGVITNEDYDVKDFIDEIASDRTPAARKSLFESYRRNHSAFENLESFGSKEANLKADELNLPHLGDKGFNASGSFGYIKEPGGYKTVMHDGLKLWLSEDEDIMVTGYITNPDPATIMKRRKHDKESIDKLNNFLYNVAAKLTDIPVDEIKAKGKSPFKYNGFLPQVISADPGKDGLPVENTKVDFDGTPMK